LKGSGGGEQKRGLMQKLLTGEVWVKCWNAEILKAEKRMALNDTQY
jgi:hypothetical protein